MRSLIKSVAAQAFAKSNKRFYYLAGFFVFWFLAICCRLIWLQVVEYGEYTQRAARQQQRSIEVSPVRGNIYDRNGNELAMTIAVDSIFAVPSEIPDIHGISALLGKILKADPQEIENRMRASHAFAWVARKVDANASARVRALNLKGIYFQKESKRFYPKKELAAQVLGYVGLDDEGLGGIEREFDSKLTGRPGKMLISMDAKRRWLGRVEKDPDPGENVVLTLDQNIQYIAERELERAMAETHAEAGTVVVENPYTGEILALANSPSFNPNSFNRTSTASLKNRAVSDIYEPGSTFKVVTLAAALDEKLTNPDEVIDCQMGSIVVNGRLIHDWKKFGALTVAQVLQNSSDVGAIKLALRLGDERFDRYIRAFGFGSQTGIELPGETRGLTKPWTRWSKVSIGAISMGQEIGVSPMQLVSMASTIANDGVSVPPRIVAATTPPRGSTQLIAFHPMAGQRVISTLTAARMKSMMEGVVLRGTGKRAVLNGYTSAGKTGTAQKTDPATGRYSKSRYVASFTGFAPVNTPALSALVVLDSPIGGHHGGEVAAPVWARVMQQALAYLNVAHDVEIQDPRRLQLIAKASSADLSEGPPDYVGDAQPESSAPAAGPVDSPQPSAMTAKSTATQQATPTTAIGVSLLPAEPRVGGTIVLDTSDGVVVPDFRGKALRTALDEADSAGIELDVSGSGIGRDQSPEPGSRISPGGHVSVRFGR